MDLIGYAIDRSTLKKDIATHLFRVYIFHFYFQFSENPIWNTLQTLSISPKSEIYFMKMVQNMPDYLVIQQIYRVDESMPLILEPFGNIVNGQFIDGRSIQITSRRRQNLRGLRLKASMVVTNNDTLNHLSDYR